MGIRHAEGFPQPQTKARAGPLTLRISNIPGGITRNAFKQILTDLAVKMTSSSGAPHQPRVLGWSFAASGHSKQSFVATATFHISLAPAQLESAIRRSVGIDWGRLRVDLDFFGLTPLADPPHSAVEYAVNASLDTCR
jgi:hypothetical protein